MLRKRIRHAIGLLVLTHHLASAARATASVPVADGWGFDQVEH